MERQARICGGGIGDGSLRVKASRKWILVIRNCHARDDTGAAIEGQAALVWIEGIELRVVLSRAAERGRCAALRGDELHVIVVGAEDTDFVVVVKTYLLRPRIQRGACLCSVAKACGELHTGTDPIV